MIHVSRIHRIAVAVALALASTTPVHASSPNTPSVPVPEGGIQWAPCTIQGAADIAAEFGERLRCGTLDVPLDHHRPRSGTISLTVLRIAAGMPERRKGALFVNPGGPGGDAPSFATRLAAVWQQSTPGDAVHGDKRRLAEAYDIVAVVPRGLPGTAPLQCHFEGAPANPILIDRSERNIAAWDLEARRHAEACKLDPNLPYISTEQTVYDHDLVRRALDEPTFNFLGASYGTWLGAWYGATYPEHVGRMVFDSAMDFTVSFEDNFLLGLAARQALFDHQVARPAAANPAFFGLGDDVAAVRDVLRTLEPRVRETLTEHLASPSSLIAARYLSDWMRYQPWMTEEHARERVDRATFAVDAGLNLRVADDARNLLSILYAPPPTGGMSASAYGTLVGVSCNDTPSTTDAGAWQAVIARHVEDHPAGYSGDLMNPCVFWHGPNAVKPAIERLARAGKILMLAGEHDVLTPVTGALHMLDRLPNARMLLLRGTTMHGLFTRTDEPCIERNTAAFLLDGTLPSLPLTECMVDNQPRALDAERFSRPADVRRWLETMSVPAARGERLRWLMPR